MRTLLKNLLIISGLLLAFACREELQEPIQTPEKLEDSMEGNNYEVTLPEAEIFGDSTIIPSNARLGYDLWIPTGSGEYGAGAYTMTGDFNADGRGDIASPKSGEVLMRFGQFKNSDGDFIPFLFRSWPVTTPWGAAKFTFSGDFDGDGRRDDIASAVGGNIYMNLGNGTIFRYGDGFDPDMWPVENTWGPSAWVRAGDFNGDGITDIASIDGTQVYMKIGTGTGFDPDTWTTNGIYGPSGFTFVGDFNNDNRDDLLTIYKPLEIRVKISEGNEFRNEDQVYTASSAGWGGTSYTWVGNPSGSGDQILTAAGSTLWSVRLLSNGTFLSTPGPTPNKWGSSGYNWLLDIDGETVAPWDPQWNGEELVSGISDYLFVH